VVLVNKDASATVHATVDLGKAASTGTLTLMTGPALDATSGYTIGGVAVPPNGAWTASSTPNVGISGNTFLLDVPPASAALVVAK
jgi:hypothetical protein